jgi:squalene synthase HpnC
VSLLAQPAPPQAPTADAVMARAQGENFPVALRLLGRDVRTHLLAVYGFARLVDELGDSVEGDRLAALDWLESELDAAIEGRAVHPLLQALTPTIAACGLSREPFARLIEANRLDQRKHSYETWSELREYCSLSADPVGEIVLAVFGQSTPERIALSDSICTALQLAEHCQDVAEDLRAGRVYLPREDMRRFGCEPEQLSAPVVGEPLRATIAFEVARARDLLREGLPLVGQLRGRARIAVAGFAGGGRAALDAIERADFDVLGGAPRASGTRRVSAVLATLAQAGRAGR